jgi:hypothetical protein
MACSQKLINPLSIYGAWWSAVSQPQSQPTQVENKFRREFEVVKEVEGREEHYRYVIEAEFDDRYINVARFEIYWYPKYPYGNYVEKVLVVSENDGNIMIDRFTIRMSWNGTGRDDIGRIVVKDVVEESPYIVWREFYEDIETAEDFEQKIKEVIEFIKEYAEDLDPLHD